LKVKAKFRSVCTRRISAEIATVSKHIHISFDKLRHGNAERENILIILEYVIAIVSGQSERRLLFITIDSISIPILLDSLFRIGAFQDIHTMK